MKEVNAYTELDDDLQEVLRSGQKEISAIQNRLVRLTVRFMNVPQEELENTVVVIHPKLNRFVLFNKNVAKLTEDDIVLL